MKCLLLIATTLCVAGCDSQPVDRELPAPRYTEGNSVRFKVRQVQQVEDPIAYNARRGVYIITDTETGVEYIGVSGIGISELGSHAAGKGHMRSDER